MIGVGPLPVRLAGLEGGVGLRIAGTVEPLELDELVMSIEDEDRSARTAAVGPIGLDPLEPELFGEVLRREFTQVARVGVDTPQPAVPGEGEDDRQGLPVLLGSIEPGHAGRIGDTQRPELRGDAVHVQRRSDVARLQIHRPPLGRAVGQVVLVDGVGRREPSDPDLGVADKGVPIAGKGVGAFVIGAGALGVGEGCEQG